MKLIVLTPTERVFEARASAIVADTVAGSLCLLPRRLDMTTALRPGVLIVRADEETFVAVDGGTLVKCGAEVTIATSRAVVGDDLLSLRRTVHERLASVDEEAREATTALSRFELTIVRRLHELEEGLHAAI